MSAVYWLARSGVSVAGRTPRPIRNALASTVTSATYAGWRSKRQVTQENMARVMGLPSHHWRVKRAALMSWSNYGRTAASMICLPSLDIREVLAQTTDVTDGQTWQESVDRAMSSGKGMIFATGHFGSWDLAAAIAATHIPLWVIADSFNDPQVDGLLQGYRRDKGVTIITTPGALRPAMSELLQGHALAIAVDRPMGPRHGVEVTYFDQRARVPAGAAALAVDTGAAVMPSYVWYAPGNRYNLKVFPAMFPRAVATRDERTREVQRLMQYVFACQEEVVRRYPTQWFMFRRFWPASGPTPPPAGAGAASAGVDRRTSSTRTAPRTRRD